MAPRLVAGIGLVTLAAMIAYGLLAGDIRAEWAWLATMPWGQVTLVDAYTGLALFALFIAYRERSAGRAAAWIVALLLLGNLVSCTYVLLALAASKGNVRALLAPRATRHVGRVGSTVGTG